MKKILVALSLLSCCTSVLAVDLTESSNNSSFSEFARQYGYGPCMTDTYKAYVSAKDDGNPYRLTYAESKQIAYDTFAQSPKFQILKKAEIPNANTHIEVFQLTLSSGTKAVGIYKTVYVDGYELIQTCRLK